MKTYIYNFTEKANFCNYNYNGRTIVEKGDVVVFLNDVRKYPRARKGRQRIIILYHMRKSRRIAIYKRDFDRKFKKAE